MKKTTLFLLFCTTLTASLAQSRSYQDLQRNFGDHPEVRSFGISGPLCRLAVSIFSHEDQEAADVLEGIKHVRFISIPMEEFDNKGLSVRGFQSRLTRDNFELVANFRDSGSDVSLYQRTEKNNDRYFLLVEDNDELLAFEMKGYIDPAAFQDSFKFSSL